MSEGGREGGREGDARQLDGEKEDELVLCCVQRTPSSYVMLLP